MPKIKDYEVTKLENNRYELKGVRTVEIELYKGTWILVKGMMSSETVAEIGKEIERLGM